MLIESTLPEPALASALGRIHSRRLRDIYRSAGWPSQDLVEIELLAAGLIERIEDRDGHATLRVTDAGIAHLARALAGNRAAFSAHHALEARVASEMQRAGRIVWRGLCLRAQVPGDRASVSEKPAALETDHAAETAPEIARGEFTPGFFAAALAGEHEAEASHRWCLAKPDVYSIRNTSVEAYVHPVVHEIKVRRADLLGDLRKPAKRAAYLDMASECWYVLGQDGRGRAIADPSEIPLECGVLVQDGERLQVARPAPRRAMILRFGVWMALAKATPLRAEDAEAQGILVPCDDASFESRNVEASGMPE